MTCSLRLESGGARRRRGVAGAHMNFLKLLGGEDDDDENGHDPPRADKAAR